jgi:hypothetical protein
VSGRCGFDPDPDPDEHADRDANFYGDPYTNFNIHPDPNGNPNEYTNRDANAYSNIQRDANPDTHANSNVDPYTNFNIHPDPNGNPNEYTNRDANAYSNIQRDANPDTCAALGSDCRGSAACSWGCEPVSGRQQAVLSRSWYGSCWTLSGSEDRRFLSWYSCYLVRGKMELRSSTACTGNQGAYH